MSVDRINQIYQLKNKVYDLFTTCTIDYNRDYVNDRLDEIMEYMQNEIDEIFENTDKNSFIEKIATQDIEIQSLKRKINELNEEISKKNKI